MSSPLSAGILQGGQRPLQVNLDANNKIIEFLAGLSAATGADVNVVMGDIAAANKVSFQDLALNEIAFIDSNGNALFVDLILDTLKLDNFDAGLANISNSSSILTFQFDTNQPLRARGLDFSHDGLYLYGYGYNENIIYQYNLSTPYAIETAVYSTSYDPITGVGQGLRFANNGTKMYVADYSGSVKQFDLSSAYDMSTASFIGIISSSGGQRGIFLKFDGTRAYTVSSSVNQWTYTSAWEVTVGESVEYTFNPSEIDAIEDIVFSSDGKRMYLSDGVTIYEYFLPTAWDISDTPVYVASKNVSCLGLAIRNDDKAIYGGSDSGLITQLDIFGDNSPKVNDTVHTSDNATITGYWNFLKEVRVDSLTIAGSLTIGAAAITETELEIIDGATISTAELNYLANASSEIQSQINTKSPIADPTFTGEIGIGVVNVSETELGILEGATLSTTQLNFVDGVTSAIQTQLNAKEATITYGIADTNVMKAENNVVSGKLTRWTATGLESRSNAEIKTQLAYYVSGDSPSFNAILLTNLITTAGQGFLAINSTTGLGTYRTNAQVLSDIGAQATAIFGTPSTVGSTNAEGISSSFARLDHIHAHPSSHTDSEVSDSIGAGGMTLAQLADIAGFELANEFEIPISFESTSSTSNFPRLTSQGLANDTTVGASWEFPLKIPYKKGSLSLTITKATYTISLANSSNYVDSVQLKYSAAGATSWSTHETDGTNQQTAGLKTFDFVNLDVSGYVRVQLQINFIAATAAQLKFTSFSLWGYYS